MCFFLPVLALLMQSASSETALFQHLWATVLPDYIRNTVWLICLTLLYSSLFALPSAYLLSLCDLPGRIWFERLLILPLALPAYVVAYVYQDLIDVGGVLYTLQQGISPGAMPMSLRSVNGAAFILALVLFPYLFLITRTALLEHGANLTDVARSLGASPTRVFFRITLPLCRPALAIGFLLIGAETMGDFATVHYFSVNTLTTAVYDSWLGHGSLSAAARLSLIMLLGVIIIVGLERWQRGKQAYFHRYTSPASRIPLSGMTKYFSLLYLSLILLFGFFIPIITLLSYVWETADAQDLSSLFEAGRNSLIVAFSAAFLAVLIALGLSTLAERKIESASRWPLSSSSLGYMIPGTVIAIAVLIPTTFFEHEVNHLLSRFGFNKPGLFLSGTAAVLVLAYLIRFQAIANGTVSASYSRISPNIMTASRTLGQTASQTLRRVQIPLLQRGLFTAGLLVFIECMKELPAALILRPFNFDTLATHVYQFVSDEQLELAAGGALIIVLLGLIPVMRLLRQ